jgi:excisionase family DNA binding protein
MMRQTRPATFVTVKEASTMLGVSKQLIRNAADDGRLKASFTSSGWRVLKLRDVEAFGLARARPKGKPEREPTPPGSWLRPRDAFGRWMRTTARLDGVPEAVEGAPAQTT